MTIQNGNTNKQTKLKNTRTHLPGNGALVCQDDCGNGSICKMPVYRCDSDGVGYGTPAPVTLTSSLLCSLLFFFVKFINF